MSRHRFLLIGALAALTACIGRDEANDAPLTGPRPAAAPSASVAPTEAVADEITSLPEDAPSICRAYLARRDLYKTQLAEQPDNEDLRDRVDGANSFLNETCR
jgi:hypothetical protein